MDPTRSTRSPQPARSTRAAGWSSPTCCPTRSRCSAAGTTTRTRPGCTSPTPWSWRPCPADFAPPRPGWCCSRASPRRASSSTPTPAPARAPSWPATRGSRCSSRGTRSSARSASTAPPPSSRGPSVDAYFAVRPRGSQLGAWASHQSSVVSGREELLAAYDEAERRYADGEVPTPDGVGRLPRAPRVGGVLAGPAGPDARPAGLPARRRTAGAPSGSPLAIAVQMAHSDHARRARRRHSVLRL